MKILYNFIMPTIIQQNKSTWDMNRPPIARFLGLTFGVGSISRCFIKLIVIIYRYNPLSQSPESY